MTTRSCPELILQLESVKMAFLKKRHLSATRFERRIRSIEAERKKIMNTENDLILGDIIFTSV